jgi:hypothetical protein
MTSHQARGAAPTLAPCQCCLPRVQAGSRIPSLERFSELIETVVFQSPEFFDKKMPDDPDFCKDFYDRWNAMIQVQLLLGVVSAVGHGTATGSCIVFSGQGPHMVTRGTAAHMVLARGSALPLNLQ